MDPSQFPTTSDPDITLQVTPEEAVGLESTCPDSDTHRNLSLVCTASKPAEVVPELSLTWTRGGIEEQSEEDVQSNGNRKTQTLMLTEVDANDAGTYVCTAIISVPNSTVVENRTSQVVYRGLPSVRILLVL